ncbi:MAG: hypothetical protein ACRDHS_03310 [Actinomycetota bacterium]
MIKQPHSATSSLDGFKTRNVATMGAWVELGSFRRDVGTGVIDGSGWVMMAPTEFTSTFLTSASEIRM